MPVLTEEERLGTVLAGKYKLHQVLGRGGMGVVFKATHEWSHREVAVKLLHPEYARSYEVAQRFLLEARAAARLEHPNVVQILDMGSGEDGAVYMAQELLRGSTLGQLLTRRETLPAEEALELLAPVMDALAVAHECGIVHRDIKPENIFLARDATDTLIPKILDFGIAKVAEGLDSPMTSTGRIVGTPAFMSPEQAAGSKEVGPPTDVWAMAVVIYHCISGVYPFEFDPRSPVTAMLVAICTATPRPIASVAPGVPEPIAKVIDDALVKEPAKRFPNMRAFRAALLAAAGNEPAALDASTPLIVAAPLGETDPAKVAGETRAPGPAAGVSTGFTWNELQTGSRRRWGAAHWMAAGIVAVGVIGIASLGASSWLGTDVRNLPVERDVAGATRRTVGGASRVTAPSPAAIAPGAIEEPTRDEPRVDTPTTTAAAVALPDAGAMRVSAEVPPVLPRRGAATSSRRATPRVSASTPAGPAAPRRVCLDNGICITE